ncbi:MAG: hypothetical protein K0R40_1868 [Burkholderiales bacterium]|nr:hypothetical protein [Burkholderiales bacterium]
MRGEENDARLRQARQDFPAGIEARPVGQAQVHQHHLRTQAARLGYRFGHRPGFAGDFESVDGAEQRAQARAHDLVIVDEQQPDRAGGRHHAR